MNPTVAGHRMEGIAVGLPNRSATILKKSALSSGVRPRGRRLLMYQVGGGVSSGGIVAGLGAPMRS
jgi:hypothetical protein